MPATEAENSGRPKQILRGTSKMQRILVSRAFKEVLGGEMNFDFDFVL